MFYQLKNVHESDSETKALTCLLEICLTRSARAWPVSGVKKSTPSMLSLVFPMSTVPGDEQSDEAAIFAALDDAMLASVMVVKDVKAGCGFAVKWKFVLRSPK